jgi:hypothetical protein
MTVAGRTPRSAAAPLGGKLITTSAADRKIRPTTYAG